MDIFLPNIWQYLSILLCAFIATYLVGRFLLCYMPEVASKTNDFSNVFTSLMLGSIALVTVFAIIWTRGNSIMLLSVVIFGFYFFVLKEKQSLHSLSKSDFKIKKNEWKTLVYSTLIFIGTFAFAYWMFFVRVNGAVFPDYPFYANVSNSLLFSHVESSFFLGENRMANFYHWGELWFNAFWSGLFDLNHYYALLLITYPYFAVLTVLGAVAIARNLLPYKNYVCVLIGMTILFFVPALSAVVSLGAVSQHPKYLPVAVFLIWYFLSITEKKNPIAALAMLLIVPFQTVMAPGALSLLVIGAAYFIYKDTQTIKHMFFNKYMLASFVVVALFILFYKMQSLLFTDNSLTVAGELQSRVANPMVRILTFSVRQSFFFVVRFVPMLLILFVLYRKQENKDETKQVLGIIACVLFSGLVAMFVASIVQLWIVDGRQIGVNYGLIISNITLFFALMYCLSQIKAKWTWVLVPMFCFYMWSSMLEVERFGIYGRKEVVCEEKINFFQQIKDSFGKENKRINFGYFRNYEGTAIGDWRRRLNFMIPLYRMVHIAPFGFYAPHALSVFDIPDDTAPIIIRERYNSPLWRFVEAQKKNNSFVSKEESILEFIKIENISHIVVERGMNLPDYLKQHTQLIAEHRGYAVYEVITNKF